MKQFLSSGKAQAALLVCVFLLMLLMTSLTPMLADDYSYSLSFAEFGKRIRTLGDVFESLAAHRESINGRMFSHGLAMLFLLAPKMVFNVFNALNAVLLLCLIGSFSSAASAERCRERDFVLLLLAALLIWEAMPMFGQVYLWLDGSLNYSWGVTVCLLFILPYCRAYREKAGRIQRSRALQILFILLAFAAGGYSEGTSSAAILIAFCFGALTLLDKRRLPLWLYAAFAAACLGFLYMVTAPGELGRSAQGGLLTVAKNIRAIFAMPREKILWLYVLFAVLLVLALMQKVERRTVLSALVFLLGNAASLGVFVFAMYLPWRGLCAPTIFLTVACLILLRALWDRGLRYLAPVLTGVFAALFVFSFVLGLGDIGVMYMESRQREAAIFSAIVSGEDSVTLPQYSSNTKYAAAHDLPDLDEDAGQWPNYDVALYYGIGSVAGSPPVESFGE